MSGMNSEPGKFKNIKIGSALRQKLGKVLNTIDERRKIASLSKISNEGMLLQEIVEAAKSKYPDARDVSERSGYEKMLYNKVKKAKFEKSNRRMLKNLYIAIRKFQRKRLDPTMLSPVCKNFYDEVSLAKDYDEFVSKIFGKYSNKPTTMRECSMEIQKRLNEKKFITLKFEEFKDDPSNNGDMVSVTVPRDFSALKSDVSAKFISYGAEAKRIYNTFVSKHRFLSLPEKEEVKKAISLGPFEQIIKKEYYPKVFKHERSEYKRIWYNLCNENNQNSIYSPYKNDMMYMIYFLYVYFTPERCEKKANIWMDKWREKKAESGKRQSSTTASLGNADTKNAEFHEGGSRVAELKKQIGGKIHGNAFRNPGDSQ